MGMLPPFPYCHIHTNSIYDTMATPEIQHQGLNATFKGTQRDDQEVPVHQFLGIKYASIPARFERAEPVNSFDGAVVDASKFGYAINPVSQFTYVLTLN